VAESSEVAGRHAPLVTQAPPASSHAESWTRRAGTTALAYFHLTKPRVIELLLVTTIPAMILAAGDAAALADPADRRRAAAGGANTINCWIERERPDDAPHRAPAAPPRRRPRAHWCSACC
jgi:protoheme IX farnesyltransferase